MRSALLCVLLAFIVHREGSLADEDFKPTPIPLGEWHGEPRAGTLQEASRTDAPPAAAAVPAHYWEDALRHSVYLTLVRDKIDQLIAKGITADGKPNGDQTQKDDHDLWEKIKSAPFDRLNVEEPAVLGDITVMAKGRLLEEKDGLRFTEDEIATEKCNEEKCNEGVKAYWSVKRVRQREAETAPGKYHYELTFSVSSQTPRKQKRPYEHPVRTFTIREGTPVERPQYRYREPIHAPRPQRAVWFHKNIVPTPPRQVVEDGLDRLFSSWFSDEEPPKRYKPVTYGPPAHPPRSKVGQVAGPPDHHHPKPGQTQYPPKPQPQNVLPNSYKYPRPPFGPPIVPPIGPSVGPPLAQPPLPHGQHSLDLDAIRNANHFTPPTPEIKYLSSNVVKTTKPAVLPTPPVSYTPKNTTVDLSHTTNATEAVSTTREPDIVTGLSSHSRLRPPPTKMSYFPEHVRPPVFNAPPGVFVTMDKKPFKPMPPLKHVHSFKHNKNKPVDFRPSPQVLDVQFSDPDPLSDSFRPIAMSYGANVTDSKEGADGEKRKPIRKTKPPKKHDKVKSHRHTTSTPDIITAHSEALGDMDWVNYLGAFAKTTPMASQRTNVTETTTTVPSTTVTSTTTEQSTPTTTEASTTTTTSRPRRTRPPPKFTKPEKTKKHKRITSTTSTSTTSTTTERPHHRRPSQDLLTQATASTGSTKSSWQPNNKNQSENVTAAPNNETEESTHSTSSTNASEASETTATSVAPTTYRAVTTTRQRTTVTTTTPSTTTEKTTTVSTPPPRSKNRFRQSTLMIKGTSVKHDKWSTPMVTVEKNKTITEKPKLVVSVSGKFPRRKGSNFHGYLSSTSKPEDRHREDHVDRISNSNLNVISLDKIETTTESISTTTQMTTQATTEESEDDNDEVEFEDVEGTEDPEDDDDEEDSEEQDNSKEDEQETKDHNEFIFDTSSYSLKSSDKLNEVEPDTTTETIVTPINSVSKNKTKCKKKKNNSSTNVASDREDMSVAPIEVTTEKLSTADFFNQIFGFTVDQNETGGNQTNSKYVDNDEDLEEFLHSINEKKDSDETSDEYDEDREENENSPFNNDEENRFARSADDDDDDERPLSFLELMALE